jgi:hypothetical protein
MKLKRIYLLLLTLVCLASNAHAIVTCQKAKLYKPTSRGSVYNFKATQKCDITGVTIDLAKVKDMYLDEIKDKKSQFKVHKEQSYDNKKGMQGYSLDVTQSYDTNHGPLRVRADVLLLDDNSKKFFMELRSTNIQGDGDSTGNKFILNQLDLEVSPERSELLVTKEIKVTPPWYAPEGMFIDTVETELLESLNKAAKDNARKISGEKVDALRK